MFSWIGKKVRPFGTNCKDGPYTYRVVNIKPNNEGLRLILKDYEGNWIEVDERDVEPCERIPSIMEETAMIFAETMANMKREARK